MSAITGVVGGTSAKVDAETLTAMQASPLPTDKQARKDTPMMSGVLDYFPAALAAVARVSKIGNDQHNPGQPMHHARGKSMDHADCIIRHLIERGTMDTDGVPHTAKAAWRVLALLQEEEEARGAPLARAAVVEPAKVPPAVRAFIDTVLAPDLSAKPWEPIRYRRPERCEPKGWVEYPHLPGPRPSHTDGCIL